MAGMFQIALDAQEPLRLDLYGFQDMEYEDEDYALRCLVKEGSVGEILDLYDETRRRINTWGQWTSGIFMSEVVRAILVHEKTPRHYVSSLGDILPQVFSEHIAKPLLRMIGNTSDNCQGPSEKDKKRRCEIRDILDCDKRRKAEI
ncbi:uncharacterized protein FPRO_15862 [Fusarium proliferatum ET1]|uniref:Uncharacterized protein n=1 Tax=Fusarium proliferatum (strain ET1) TaxID=1227346 RepID=A0A1L7WA56_FUSPR|nr:uncharacterized protein FPRO_15862 [Fusarium proliferatum ET1]CZR49502.1 uncharacterized protein FPRO_15862 [Fusarium proliferatum ET1]